MQLDLFHIFYGDLFLDSSQTGEKKLGINSNAEYLYFHDGKYLSGLHQIDQTQKIENLYKIKKK